MTLANTRWRLGWLFPLLLAGCGTQTSTTGTEPLRFLTATLPAATVGDTYSQDINLTSGTRPYTVTLAKGTLPPGLRQADRTITGTPTTPGNYTFTLEASDANLSVMDKDFSLTVAPAPARKLEWILPPTAVSGETTIPFTLRAARGVTSVRAAIPLPAGATILAVTPRDLKPILVWRFKAGVLRVDAAPTQVQTAGGDATLFNVRVQLPQNIRLAGTVGYEVRVGSRPVATGALATPAPATPAAGTTPTAPTTGTPAGPTTPPATPTTPAAPGTGTTPAGDTGTTPVDNPTTGAPAGDTGTTPAGDTGTPTGTNPPADQPPADQPPADQPATPPADQGGQNP